MAHLGLGEATVEHGVDDARVAIVNLARGFSLETTPRQAEKVADFGAVLPRGSRVFIAFIPGEQPAAILALAGRLLAEGMVPVPHIAARNLASAGAFERFARDLHGVGVRQALLLAGGASHPAGSLASSLELLESGVIEGLGFEQVFVAGHPEGHADVGPGELAAALGAKNEWARRTGVPATIVTQFGFDGEAILAWAQAIGAAGNRLPIRVGVAGPASLASLLKYAKMCGVNASMTMLAKAGGRLIQLVGQSTPDGLITDLATQRQGWSELVRDLHFYPFGGFERTASWATRLSLGAITLHGRNAGFTVTG
jgi:methylenetetrahydrofolate reductase (NADPH)